MGLPFTIHFGGHGGINRECVANGPSTFSWEAHGLLGQGAMTHVTSMIAHGVFEKHPDLKFVILECGVTVFAPLLWRMDADYRALKKETPWLKMLPSEYFRRNVRIGTQPLEEAPDRRHLWALLEAMYADETVVFASDFPHWDFDDLNILPLPPHMRDNILGLTALKTFTKLPMPDKDKALAAE